MDKRKLKFLIGIQREIDLLETKSAKDQNMEKIKAKFYDLAQLEDVASSGSFYNEDGASSVEEEMNLTDIINDAEKTENNSKEDVSKDLLPPPKTMVLGEDNHLGAIDELIAGEGQFITLIGIKNGDDLKFYVGDKSKKLYNNYSYNIGDTVYVGRTISGNGREYFNTLPKGSKLPIHIDPYDLYKFLFEYNQNMVLKTTCHEADSDQTEAINSFCNVSEYDFENHIREIIKAFISHEKTYRAPFQIKALFRGYLTGQDYKGEELKNGWSTEDVEINWKHVGLLNWATKNKGCPPHLNETVLGDKELVGFEFGQINSKISGKTIQNFTQLVLHFKDLFHIRNDNSLREIIERTNKDEEFVKNIDFKEFDNHDFPRNISHFTNVDRLRQVYIRLIRIIIKQGDSKPVVKLKFYELGDSIWFSIHHLNSVYKKSANNAVDAIGMDYGYLISQVKGLNGLCNFYLNADFGNNEFCSINLWNELPRKKSKISEFSGVEHLLEFPTKKK